MTEAVEASTKKIWPPDQIADRTFDLDDMTFTPTADRRFERAERNSIYLDDVLADVNGWFARKIVDGEMSDWLPMRCVHEARAFLVSKTRRQ